MSLLYKINMEVPAPGDSLSWDTNLFVCDITTNDLFVISKETHFEVRLFLFIETSHTI